MWAKSYIPSGTAKSFTATTDIIVAGTGEGTGENFTNSVIAAGKAENWITIPSEQYVSKTPTSDSEIDTPTSNVHCLWVKADGNTFNHEKRVIHFKVTGITGVKAIGQANSGRGFQIGATEVTSGLNENSSMTIVAGNSSAQNPVSCSGLDKSKTYIISIFAYNSDTFLYAVRFYSDTEYPVSNISVANLCYAVGTGGKNANNGLDRAVGGFNLTFGGGDGIKYNGGNQLLARYTGTITIALDDNNSKKNIKKVVFTKSSAGDGTFTASDNTIPTNSGTTITWEGTACKTITFTHSGANFLITNIAITTDVTPVFEKVTPTVTIDPTSASVKKGTEGTFTTTATSSPTNFNWTWTPTALPNVGYYTKNDGGTKTANQIGEPGTFETSTSSTTTGNNTLVASFAGNDYFEAVPTAATYTLSINEPVASTPDANVQIYPYTWNFDNGSSTWGSSSTQLPASDWIVDENNASYYHYSVPDALTGFNIDAIKGLRFQNIGYLGLDWNYGHIWSTSGTITIPSVPAGMTIKINAANQNGENPATTITTSANATYNGSGTATLAGYADYAFKVTSAGDVSFAFSGSSSIKSISVEKTTPEFRRGGSSDNHIRDNGTMNLSDATSSGWFYIVHDPLITNSNITVSCDNSNVTCGTVNYHSTNTSKFQITANSVGTSVVTISYAGSAGLNPATITLHLNVIQNATPKKWDFENASSSYWSTTNGQLSSDYWVTSSDATNNPGEMMSNVAFNHTELTKDGTNKIPEMEGLVMTAVKGSSRFNIGQYYRLGNYSKASITIPSMTTGQTVTFKVETATSGMERGITATSSNLELISGQVSDKVSYYTFRVTSDGDGEFRQTSEDAGLKIYYIDLKAATSAATELKFVDNNNNDISNKQVNIKSGSVTGALDSYFQLSKSSGTEWKDVTVTVDPSSLLTYDNDGTFTMGSGKGTATITACTTDGSVETGIAVLYVSVKAQPTVMLSANGPFSVNYGQDFNGATSTVTGTSNAGLTVLYKSSNERVATVDASGHVTCVGVGTATITAYTEETETYLPAEASYQVTYNAGNVVFQFEPSEVKLALGKNITPFLHYDQKGQLNASTLSCSVSKSDIVTCQVVADDKESDKNVIKITSLDNASKIGETVIVTAKAQTKGESPIWYYTTIAVTITAADAVNFDWVNGDDIYVYENTYFPIPGYTGNASGNNSYSNGSANASTHKAYLYVKNGGGNPVWNTQNYKLNEGVPDYYVDDTGKALIFWAKSDKSAYPDTLLVYAKAAGTVKLHAKDSQTGAECSPITIHILAKSGLEDAHTEEVNTISLPYTWDFTKDFIESDFTNSMFWKSTGSGRYDNTAVWMNEDWADELGEDKFAVNFLGGTGAGSPMALFKGAQIRLGNSTYNSKIGRIQVKPNAEDGNSHLTIIGGQHYLYLPQIPVERTPNQAYRLYVKAKGQTTKYKDGIRKDDECSRIIVDVDNGSGGYDWLGMLVYAEEHKDHGDYIVKCLYCDIPAESAGKTLRLNFDQNVELYWIALTTEAKTLSKFDNTKYWASTYSYTKDLDLSKSKEVHPNVIAHYASEFSGQNKVKMTEVPNNAVLSETGLFLKAETNPGNSYFIANAENVSVYSAPSPISGTNYLKANPEVGTKINANTTIGDNQYTNFTLAYRYKVVHAGGGIDSDYTYADDWSFYRIAPSGITVSNKNLAYLQVPGDLYIDAYSSRRAGDATGANPASQELLKIVFDDDNNTGTTDLDISTVTPQTVDNGAWYTLQGVRVSAPLKGGIYIHNGKKIVVK